MRYRTGLALILVVGILAVLAVLGSAFAVLARLERRAGIQRLASTKAFLLVRSGLEDAQARLDAWQAPDYGGEDWNNDKILQVGPETDGQVYQPLVLNRSDCPVRQALRPSFCRVAGGNPKLIQVNGRPRGYSGILSGETATWSLKVVPDGGFPVNGGDPSSKPPDAANLDLNYELQRMFGILADAIDREDGAADNVPVGNADGLNLIAKRPSTGWESFEQIRDVALGGSQAKLNALRDYLQIGPWTDLKVAAPFIDPTDIGKHYRSMACYRTGDWNGGMANLSTNGPSRMAPDLEKSPRSSAYSATTGGRLVGRAPVDLAWARTRRPAMIALLGNLRGSW